MLEKVGALDYLGVRNNKLGKGTDCWVAGWVWPKTKFQRLGLGQPLELRKPKPSRKKELGWL